MDFFFDNLQIPNDLITENTREGLDKVRWMAPEVVSPPIFSSESDETDIQEGEITSDPYKVTPASDVHSFGMTALGVRLLVRIYEIQFSKSSHSLALHSRSSFFTP
jgi:hypothetical protein